MEKIDLTKDNLKKFGITMGIAFLVIALFVLARHKHSPLVLFSVSAIFFLLTFIIPGPLKPIYILWMRLAFLLSWVNTRLILMIMFYLIFTPIGLVMRIFRIDLLERKIDRGRQSYWKEREKKEFLPLNYERQF